MLWTLLLLIDHQFICDSVCSIANATKDYYCIVGIERLVLMDTIGGRHFSCGITRRMEVSFSFYGYFFRRTVCQKCNFVPNTGCPNKFRILFWSSEMNVSEASIVYKRYEKIVLCSKKLLFQPHLWTAKLKMEFFSHFAPIALCSNLFSKLLEIGEKLLKNPCSFFAVYQKGWTSNFLERNTNFFVNDARFARKHFWAYSKLVGTPCK